MDALGELEESDDLNVLGDLDDSDVLGYLDVIWSN